MEIRRQEEHIFFDTKTSKFYCISVPMIILFATAIGVFIATSFWSVDLAGAQTFAKGMEHNGVLYWTQYYSASGTTQLFVTLIILIMVIVETLYMLKRKYKHDHNKNITKYESITVWLFYLAIVVLWLVLNIRECVALGSRDKGFGAGFDNEIMHSFKYKQTGKIISFVLETIYLGVGIWWVRFKMTKRPDFWYQQYWLDATKALTFFAIAYIAVALLKWGVGRDYFYNYEFHDLLMNLNDPKSSTYDPQAYQHYMDIGSKTFGWGFGANHMNNAPGPLPWWKWNGSFNHPATDPILGSNTAYSFPSGHVTAEFCGASIMFLFVGGRKQNRKFSWWKKLILLFIALRILSMNFAVVTMRWHWFSDTSFSVMWCIVAIVGANALVNVCYNAIDKKVVNEYNLRH